MKKIIAIICLVIGFGIGLHDPIDESEQLSENTQLAGIGLCIVGLACLYKRQQ